MILRALMSGRRVVLCLRWYMQIKLRSCRLQSGYRIEGPPQPVERYRHPDVRLHHAAPCEIKTRRVGLVRGGPGREADANVRVGNLTIGQDRRTGAGIGAGLGALMGLCGGPFILCCMPVAALTQKQFRYVGQTSTFMMWMDPNNDFAEKCLDNAGQHLVAEVTSEIATKS